MESIWNWLIANIEWLFSGIGVFLLGLVYSIFKKMKNRYRLAEGDKITTHGDLSPGKVVGNYEVNIHEEKESTN